MPQFVSLGKFSMGGGGLTVPFNSFAHFNRIGADNSNRIGADGNNRIAPK